MPQASWRQVTIEKTPSYFVTKNVPKRIFTMSPKMKLIIVVRDPVTRAISDYTQAKAKKKQMPSFEEMVFLGGSRAKNWGAIRIGVYSNYLKRWLKYFPARNIHIVHGERLINDPGAELALLQDFLGLERQVTQESFYFDPVKKFPCLRYKQSLSSSSSSSKPTTSSSFQTQCLGKTKGRRHPKVDPMTLTYLRDYYRPYNQLFYRMIGVNFAWP
ncbi:hypothetical protein HELRODRAFT_157311 [Helobdella robusta]|uniref:Sulfotransferase domain-containing protein n=1 Tax=Helobdella robusta TaxID=6412 RepID=T1EM94_HELRO|nr:hypothetical protein HELRODRAFT_157311 [Helobdella robusta]ESO00917.1 hypothetical protein HELRODRAFT_157311 [Helobdella robusta]